MTSGKTSDDKELVEAFKNGSEEAFDELVRRHSGRIYQTAYGLLGNREDAEEVAQDAFVRAHKALEKFRGDSSFETWIYRIAVNLARNKYMWNKRRGSEMKVSLSQSPSDAGSERDSMEEMSVPDSSGSPDLALESKELETGLRAGLKKLPPALRETMMLRHVNEFSYEKIAGLLDCNIGTVKSRIARGRQMLRDFIIKFNGVKAETVR